MKKNILYLFLYLLISCTKNEIPIVHLNQDAEIKRYEKLDKNNLGKISMEGFHDLDTVSTNLIKLNVPLKNIGNKNIQQLFLKTTCDCTGVKDYKKNLDPNETDTLKIAIDITKEKGYFTKKAILYGSFYPYKRVIEVVGYKQ